MRTKITNCIKNLPLLAVILLALACTRVDWKDIETLKPGYLAISDSSEVNLVLTRDEYSGEVAYDPVDIRLRFFISTQEQLFSRVGVTRSILDESGTTVASVVHFTTTDLSDTLRIDILDKEALFEGLDFHPDSIRSGYSFLFKTFMILQDGDSIVSSRGDYQAVPQYLNFCTYPEIPDGVWEVHNKATGFKKEVEIKYMEVYPTVWFYVITDFGIDWSNWNDFWYGTDFTLGCPKAGDNRFVVKLAAWGIDLPHIRLEMKNDQGDLETRPLRIMPWTYADDSPDIGYYDAGNRQFIFKNVKVRDTWWNIDNKTITEVTYTYRGQ